MPAGDKIAVSIVMGTQVLQVQTFTPDEDIINEIEGIGPKVAEMDPVWAVFKGLNNNDQSVLVKAKREKIDGYVIAPLIRMAVQPAQGRIVQ